MSTATIPTPSAISAQSAVTIRPVAVFAIFDAPNSADLFDAYARECLVPGSRPDRAQYESMEAAGMIQCFSAAAPDRKLVGFVSVITVAMPHGQRIGTVESIFVDPAYRHTGAGNLLLDAAERHARAAGCVTLVMLARIGSPFDRVLSRRKGCKLTHSQYSVDLRADVADGGGQ